MFYRSVGVIAFLLVAIAIRERGRLLRPFFAMGRGGFLAALVLSGSMICYVLALTGTTVANAMFVMSTGPFFTALLAWLLLGERIRPLTGLAIAAAVLGMALMSADGLAGGGIGGLLAALGNAVAFASIIVLTRRYRDTDLLPAFVLGAVVVGIVAWLAIDPAVGAHDAAVGIGFGAFHTAAGLALLPLGARRVPAAAAALLMLSEPILAPIWVWLAVDETPTRLALLGGLAVLAAVAGQAAVNFLSERRAAS
jgi:drug/metabolite transporter (DMT)-like permease